MLYRLAPVTASLAVSLLSLAADAATFTVTSTADSGEGSLRNAVLAANNNGETDTIEIALAPDAVITLTSGALELTSNLHIRGPDRGSVTIDAGGRGSGAIIVDVSPAGDGSEPAIAVVLERLRISNARADNGSAVAVRTAPSINGQTADIDLVIDI